MLKFLGNTGPNIYYPRHHVHVSGALVHYKWWGTPENSWFNGSATITSDLNHPNVRHVVDQNGNSFQGPSAYTVRSSAKKEDVDQGISTIDMVLLRVQMLELGDIGSHKEAGGDINEDGELKASDLLLLRRLILRQPLSVSESSYYWRFIPTSRLFNEGFHADFRDNPFEMNDDPLVPDYQEPFLYPNWYNYSYQTNYGPYDASAFPCRQSFSAIKPGDSNNSHPDINTSPAFWEVLNSCREGVDLPLTEPEGDGYVEDHFAGFKVFNPTIPSVSVSPGSYACFDLKVSALQQIDDLIGFQTSWNVPDGFELQNIKFNGHNLGVSEYYHDSSQDELNVVWIDELGSPVDIPSNSPFVNIEFCLNNSVSGSISDNSNFLDEFVMSETSTTTGISLNYTLNTTNPPITIKKGNYESISIEVANSGKYMVLEYNSVGQILSKKEYHLDKGLNKLDNALFHRGVSFISVKGENYQTTFSFIR